MPYAISETVNEVWSSNRCASNRNAFEESFSRLFLGHVDNRSRCFLRKLCRCFIDLGLRTRSDDHLGPRVQGSLRHSQSDSTGPSDDGDPLINEHPQICSRISSLTTSCLGTFLRKNGTFSVSL